MKHKIVLLPFPFDDFKAQKVRPAICLTEAVGEYRHVVLAFITSQTPKILEKTDLVLNQKDKNFSQTGLRLSSTIRLHRLISLPTSSILRELGKLPKNLQEKLQLRLGQLFGLS